MNKLQIFTAGLNNLKQILHFIKIVKNFIQNLLQLMLINILEMKN